MPNISPCPSCGKKLKTPDGAAGKKLRCPQCQSVLLITDDGLELAGKAPAGAPVKKEVQPAKKRPVDDDEVEEKPKKKKTVVEDDVVEEEEALPSKKKKKGGIPLWVWLASGGGLAAVLVVVLILVLSGGNKFGKLKEGMTAQEVKDILGEPATGDLKTFGMWFDPPISAKDYQDIANGKKQAPETKEVLSITFADGKVKEIARLSGKELKGGRRF